MGYRSTRACVEDLRRHGHLVEVTDSVDARLQVAEIQRRVFASGGPALLFSNVRDTAFPMASNLFGTMERARFLFRDTLDDVRRAIEIKIDPAAALRKPFRYWRAPWVAWSMQPRRKRSGPVLRNETRLSLLPQLVSWPDDGGGFVTLPQVYSEAPGNPGLRTSNLGMYRIQISGNAYVPDREVGLHYQIHRSIGVHHAEAMQLGKPFRVNVFVGGAPAMSVAAVMPLPEGMSELTFAGALAGHRIPMVSRPDAPAIYGDADFCISGTIDPDGLKPEGPFGDHLGYYSLQHDYPVLRVDKVWHRDGAVWPFTVVGRPPQEDTMFGELIHELTGPVIPTVLPGVEGVHAVDAAGVHPLLLAIGSERYTPWQPLEAPQELLTQANAILGQGQLSLAKYLWIIDRAAAPDLVIHNTGGFLQRVLERVDWQRDLHFQTRTTIDTLDYSGQAVNQGSKVVIAAVGPAKRQLAREVPSNLRLPDEYTEARVCLPGVLAIGGCPFQSGDALDREQWWSRLRGALTETVDKDAFPLIVVVDDAEFVARTETNFLWTVFTRSDPASDIFGVGATTTNKHWGCSGPLIIDARIKPHHAPPLVEDPETTSFVDALAARGGELGKWL